MLSIVPPQRNLTVPAGAGPGSARLFIGPDLPPPLNTYVSFEGPYAAALIWYSQGDDTTYTYEAVVSNISGGSTSVHRGFVLSGAVSEASPGVPHGTLTNSSASGNPDTINISASNISIAADGIGGALQLTGGALGVFIGGGAGTTIRGALSWFDSTGATQYTSLKATDNTARTSGSTSYIALAGGALGVAFTTPPSGKVSLSIAAAMSNSLAAGSTRVAWQIRTGSVVGSGTIVITATDDLAIFQTGTDGLNYGREYLVDTTDGLTGNTSYNAELLARVTSGTGTWLRRSLIIKPAL